MGLGRITGARARAGWWIALFAVLAGPSMAAAANAGDGARVLYAEPLQPLSGSDLAASRKAGATGTAQLRFDAYGRRFEIALEPNTRLQEQLKSGAISSSLQLYRGQLQHAPSSWVRLAAGPDKLHGMIWDGTDLYVIEPASEVRDTLMSPPSSAADTLIFRLKDVLIEAGAAACAADDAAVARKADDAFGSLLTELKGAAATTMQAGAASRRLSLSVLGDAAFLQRYPSAQDARDAILTRLNNVDGIFSAQLGIEMRVGNLSVHDAASDPLSSAAAPNALLQDLAKLRKRSPDLNAFGLTHLFTGRDLEGTTIGIAYVDTLCQNEHGAGLTETRNLWLDSLVAAHEIGHNFGADHDGDTKGTCASAPASGYLMGPTVSGGDTFSQCSLNRIQSRAQSASCITALPPANVAIPANLGDARHALGASFEWALTIVNSGGIAATNVRAEMAVPPFLTITSAAGGDGSCAVGGGKVDCQLGTLAGGSSQVIKLLLHADAVGSTNLSATVRADSDSSALDNGGTGTITIEPEADLQLSLHGPTAMTAAEAFALDFQVVNQATISASAIRVSIALPTGVVARSATLGGGTCSTEGSHVRCTLGALAAAASASGRLSLSASTAGIMVLHASVAGAYLDPNTSNDSAHHTIQVEAAAVPAAQTSAPARSGGGGSMGLLLLGLLGLRRTRRYMAS